MCPILGNESIAREHFVEEYQPSQGHVCAAAAKKDGSQSRVSVDSSTVEESLDLRSVVGRCVGCSSNGQSITICHDCPDAAQIRHGLISRTLRNRMSHVRRVPRHTSS